MILPSPCVVFFIFSNCLTKSLLKMLDSFFFPCLFESQIFLSPRVLHFEEKFLVVSIDINFEKVLTSKLLDSKLVYSDFVLNHYALWISKLVEFFMNTLNFANHLWLRWLATKVQ